MVSGEKPRVRMFQQLLKPIITEKSSACGDVVLAVDPRMNKDEIRASVEAVFEVKVKSVRTLNQKGKVKGAFGKIGRRKSYKKAYITLVEGQVIELIEGL
jgi:large subunit ribosomal protein L23